MGKITEMMTMEAPIEKFGKMGEKTGWTYVFIPFEKAVLLNPKEKKSYRVKGNIDKVVIKQVAILPMGDGNFILPLNADLRAKLKKPVGEIVSISLTLDVSEIALNQDLISCLEDYPIANAAFNKMLPSHRRYYSNHVESAKTDKTKAKRITNIILSLEQGLDFAAMLKMK